MRAGLQRCDELTRQTSTGNIILIGMPGVGKSTVGVLLAKRIGFAFVDTDLLIQTGEAARLQQIIQACGMDDFCDLEAGYIMKISDRRSVIATGGSVIYRSEAMAHLQALGRIVLLDIDQHSLAERLANLDDRGVVRMPGQTIAALYAERRPLYRRYAQVTVPCSECTPDQVVRRIVTDLQKAAILAETPSE